MTNKVLANHVFVFNSSDNGGESLFLATEFYGNGVLSQKLCLQSYANCATFELNGATMTPRNLQISWK